METRQDTRRRWTTLVARFERSGLSQAQFASRNAVSLPSLRYWIYKLRTEEGGHVDQRGDEVRLVPVEVRPTPAAAVLSVDVRTLRVLVPGDADPEHVARLVAALRAQSC